MLEFDDEIEENEGRVKKGKEPRRTRAERRHNDYREAIRKKKLADTIYHKRPGDDWEYYRSLHQYSKNKIHCSCPMCTEKTNGRASKSKGPVCAREATMQDGTPYTVVRGSRIPTTHSRMGRKNYNYSDRKKVEKMKDQEREYTVEAVGEAVNE